MDKEVKSSTMLDGGTTEENILAMKELFGLSPDQSFQDLDVDEDEI